MTTANTTAFAEQLRQTERIFKSRLKRKVRELRSELENRMMDYNGAMTALATDILILRQEVDPHILLINLFIHKINN